jgi:hypothetical protein
LKVPEGYTQDQVLLIIDKVTTRLAPRFRFGYHSVEDLKQEGARFALEVLERGVYDASRPLENFLFIHVRNRLSGYKRDNYLRSEEPCSCTDCKRHLAWKARNEVKRSLMSPIDVELTQPLASQAEGCLDNDILNLIDDNLPLELRSDYLRMRERVALPKARRMRVQNAIIEILASRNMGASYVNEPDEPMM